MSSDLDAERKAYSAHDMASEYPDLFKIRDGQVYVLPSAEGKPCPCCGLPLRGSPLPRAEA